MTSSARILALVLAACSLAPLPAIAQEAEPSEAEVAVEAETEVEVEAPPQFRDPLPRDQFGRSAYGLYLSGKVATRRGDGAEGADLLSQSQRLAPADSALVSEAFEAALISGQVSDVVRLAPSVRETDYADVGRLFVVLDSLKSRQGPVARQTLDAAPFSEPFAAVARYLGPVVMASAGDWVGALSPVELSPNDPMELVLRGQRAQLLELRGRREDADAEYQKLMALPGARGVFGLHYGAFLERSRQPAAAETAYRLLLGGLDPDPRALDGLARLASQERPPQQPELTEIAASALAVAGRQAREADQRQLAVAFKRMASFLDNQDANRLALGQALAEVGLGKQAIAVLDTVSQATPIFYAAAEIGRSDILSAQGDSKGALEAIQRADAAAPRERQIARRLAAQLSSMDRDVEALAVLDRPGLNTANRSVDVRYLRGRVLNRLGRVDEAEAELWSALQILPDNPALLNALGYLWVDSGRRVQQGAEMLARAHAADPDNGEIQDSLGWAQYRQGLYDAAVETLEQAVAKVPASAEVNDHLGDAYWRAGRTREASWRWSRVLTLDPDAETRAAVEAKLASGLADADATDGG